MESSFWDFVPIQKRHKRSEFDCGNSELNQYLRRYARQNDVKGINKAFVATQPDTPLRGFAPDLAQRGTERDRVRVDGYYTISSSVINFLSLPGDAAEKLPAYPVPAALIGRLAVDVSCQGEGLGTELLVNALQKIVKASSEIGIYAVRVDAIDERAKQFYLKHEFIPFKDSPLSLFLPLKTIKREFEL